MKYYTNSTCESYKSTTGTSITYGDNSTYYKYYDHYYDPYKKWKPRRYKPKKEVDEDSLFDIIDTELNKEKTPEELMKKEYEKMTSDGKTVQLTLGEIYELDQMGYRVEDMTFEELKKALVVIRL